MTGPRDAFVLAIYLAYCFGAAVSLVTFVITLTVAAR